MGNLIKGQEDYVYVWTLGVKGIGDGSDKLVTIDANPASSRYGKVIHKVSVRGRGEAHHMGFTDDRRFLWAGGLDNSRIFVFDVGTDPAKPQAREDDLRHAGQDRVRRPAHLLRAARPHDGPGPVEHARTAATTGMALYSNKGELVATYPMPTTDGGDGYGYDVAINPQKNVMLTSSFTGWKNYMMDARQGREGRRGDEEVRQHDGGRGISRR